MNETLDREASAYILFNVTASDQGNPMLYRYVNNTFITILLVQLHSMALVNITLLDANDNCPSFNVTSYSLEIDEVL